MFRLGMIINPMAGLGGAVGLKGSDGSEIVDEAIARGAVPQSGLRVIQALEVLKPHADQLDIYCYEGAMGKDVVSAVGLSCHCVGQPQGDPTTSMDTISAAQCLKHMAMDLILFAGGDGTARDIFTAVGNTVPVLGIPAGVKMHSGVYTVSPQAAGQVVVRLMEGALVDIDCTEVRDIDEGAFREGKVRSKFYGELMVPKEGHFLQHVKSSGREVEELVVQDIGADLVEVMEDCCLYLVGPGTTPSGFMEELDLDNTLLGVDAIYNQAQVGKDLSEGEILGLLASYPNARIVVTAIGGQGHVFGRGNQQLSAAVIRKVGLENIIIVATKTKITELGGRPLLVDTGDPILDQSLTGYRQVITGYHDSIIYPLGVDMHPAVFNQKNPGLEG